ncbi:hypothetical protein TNCT_290271 [Trichonephila clavata]|uniref:Uncharacterized protein n=1 Tax=Trichonephila clavata TaxID=2740835 RepID=A0A8X6II46_TRICU|nr:hypothetical protein TNCT_290271 [Trichonephila clavata]
MVLEVECEAFVNGGRVFPELLSADDVLILPTCLCISDADLTSPDTHTTTENLISTVPDSATAFPSPSGSPNSALQYLTDILVATTGTTVTPYPTETTQSCPRDTSQMERLNTPGTSTQIMETDDTPVSPTDAQRCRKIHDTEKQIYQESGRLNFLDYLINGEVKDPNGPSEQLPDLIQQRDKLQAFLNSIKGELALLFPCPFSTCQHNTAPKHLELTATPNANNSLADKLAETHIREEPIIKEKAKKNLLDGFTSPSKTAKRARILQNYSVGAKALIETSNKFQSLAGSDTQPTLTDAATLVAPPPPRSPHNVKVQYQI